MGRIKFDINVKPNEFVNGHFLVRFTNEDALNFFVNACVNETELKPNVKAVRLDEWFPMTDKMNFVLKKMKFYNGDYTLKMISYTWNTKNWDWC